MPCHSLGECLGKGPIKNILQHTHEIREGTQSHCDEIMISNESSTDSELVPAKAAGEPVGRGQGEVDEVSRERWARLVGRGGRG
ncbi:hypothetical protein JOQ06_002491 [Pogonophryne albipinna]|uniref:Uncharacterized protein n=1 Tax=Pogonophryne albipinna TaxID=1090488 RepID=A0AAD6FJQ0_9TELE|nr:hypothetical protein JOQ06_002491 [Pogonophryne albipinna]